MVCSGEESGALADSTFGARGFYAKSFTSTWVSPSSLQLPFLTYKGDYIAGGC